MFEKTFYHLYQSDFPCAVKMSGISCVGKLCSRFRSLWNDSMDGLLPSDATKFSHEVINHIYVVYPRCIILTTSKYSSCFQLYHSVVPKLLECINTVKIAQVCSSLICDFFFYGPEFLSLGHN